jgi:hypothetical protein
MSSKLRGHNGRICSTRGKRAKLRLFFGIQPFRGTAQRLWRRHGGRKNYASLKRSCFQHFIAAIWPGAHSDPYANAYSGRHRGAFSSARSDACASDYSGRLSVGQLECNESDKRRDRIRYDHGRGPGRLSMGERGRI